MFKIIITVVHRYIFTLRLPNSWPWWYQGFWMCNIFGILSARFFSSNKQNKDLVKLYPNVWFIIYGETVMKVSVDLRETRGIVEKLVGLTPWILIPKGNGNVHLCINLRMPNRAIQREASIPNSRWSNWCTQWSNSIFQTWSTIRLP